MNRFFFCCIIDKEEILVKTCNSHTDCSSCKAKMLWWLMLTTACCLWGEFLYFIDCRQNCSGGIPNSENVTSFVALNCMWLQKRGMCAHIYVHLFHFNHLIIALSIFFPRSPAAVSSGPVKSVIYMFLDVFPSILGAVNSVPSFGSLFPCTPCGFSGLRIARNSISYCPSLC